MLFSIRRGIISSICEQVDHHASMKTRERYIAFFDLDGTILKQNSGKILVYQAYKSGMMARRELFFGMYLSLLHKLDLMSPLKIIEKMAVWVTGFPEKVLQEFAEEVFNSTLQVLIRSEIPSELHFHKARNAELVILSSAIGEVHEGHYTSYPEGNFCVGTEKFLRLQEYCSMKGYLPGEAYFYGDTISDLQALSAVGHPVCVNPDRKLNRVANANGWDVRQWT